MSSSASKEYINQQALRSAVEKFSDKHEKNLLASNQKVYSELIPSALPETGQQFAFEVDLDKCTGCKACVTACHNENGLDETETWRSVGFIQGGDENSPKLQHVTSACHHCVDPACMTGCPTKAYKKDDITGVVKHLDDQCFGCQYCILKCPYDVPKYNRRKGIVHKCDMCAGRLEKGEAPACVLACPSDAIRITVVNQEDARNSSQDFVSVADAPASDYTFPTTRYTGKEKFPENMRAADHYAYEPEHAHLPLVFMLTLTQLSVGSFATLFFLEYFTNAAFDSVLKNLLTGISLVAGLIALASSIFHLGRPQYFFRAVLGYKTSWLSREILSFAFFAKAAVLYTLATVFQPIGGFCLSLFGQAFFPVLAVFIILFGFLGVYCSVMVYQDTRRPFWELSQTAWKFYFTGAILGMATILNASLVCSFLHPELSIAPVLEGIGNLFIYSIFGLVFSKLLIESTIFLALTNRSVSLLKKTALLMTNQLRKATICRFIGGIFGGFIVPSFMLQMAEGQSFSGVVVFSFLGFIFLLTGELLERYIFFRAVVPLKMPGGKL